MFRWYLIEESLKGTTCWWSSLNVLLHIWRTFFFYWSGISRGFLWNTAVLLITLCALCLLFARFNANFCCAIPLLQTSSSTKFFGQRDSHINSHIILLLQRFAIQINFLCAYFWSSSMPWRIPSKRLHFPTFRQQVQRLQIIRLLVYNSLIYLLKKDDFWCDDMHYHCKDQCHILVQKSGKPSS